MEGHFLQSLDLPRAGPCQCQRREMTVSTNNGLVNGPVHNLLMQFFTLGSSKIEVFETCYYDIVITQYDHPNYVKHVLGRIYMFFTLFGYLGRGGGGSPKGPRLPLKEFGAAFGPEFAPNAGSLLRNKRHLYSSPSCSSPLKSTSQQATFV